MKTSIKKTIFEIGQNLEELQRLKLKLRIWKMRENWHSCSFMTLNRDVYKSYEVNLVYMTI